MNRTTRWRGGVAIAAAVAATTLGLATPAFAAAPNQVINTTHAISLNITKLTNGDTVTPGVANGSQQSTTGAHPVQGAGFTIYPITYSSSNIDLRSNTGWQQAASLAAQLNTGTWTGLTTEANAKTAITAITNYGIDETAGHDLTGTTDVNGLVSWSNAAPDGATWTSLQMGLYLVVETTKPTSATAPIVPFLVTVPITDPTNHNAWNYDVYAYPKNAINSLTKAVDDSAALVGENSASGSVTKGERLQYTLSSTIPDYTSTSGTHASAVLTDTFPTQLDVSNVNASATANADRVTVKAGATTLTPTTDYTVGVAGQVVTVTLTSTGLATLDSNGGNQLVVTIPAIAKTASATITNGDSSGGTPASITFTDNTSHTTTVGVKTPVTTKYGLITLTKYEDANHNNTYDAGTDTLISGAVFELYTSATNDFTTATVYTQGADDPTSVTPTAPVTFTTNASGQLTALVRYNTTGTGSPTEYYWLVETQSTNGHELLAQPIAVTVNAAAVSLNVQDPKANAGFTLPLTGGFGTFVFYAVGGGIVALTIILLLVLGARRRKEHTHQ